MCVLCCLTAAAQDRKVAMTFDDLPFAGTALPAEAATINQAILGALRKHHAPAIGFFIGETALKLSPSERETIMRDWTKGAFDLGNHTYSHPNFSDLTLAAFEDDVTKGDNLITPALAAADRKPRWLRFPYNHTGDTSEKHEGIDAFLKSRGEETATCTIDNTDYEFAEVYARALGKNDRTMEDRVKADYLAYTAKEIDYSGTLGATVFGREIPQVMLLHASRLNAAVIETILTMFEQKGYRFVTLAEAQSDRAYSTPDTFVTSYGPMWGYRWAAERGVQVNGRLEPVVPHWIEASLAAK